MYKKAIFALLLSNLPFTTNTALAVENQSLAFNETTTINAQTTVDLNSATAEQLMTLKGIGKKKAEAIILYRQAHNGFKRIEELEQVKGIGPKLLAHNLRRLTLTNQPMAVNFAADNQIPLNRTPYMTPE